MCILDFGYEGSYRKTPVWYPRWLGRLPRPVNPMARLHFLVALRRFRHFLPLGRSACVLEAGSGRGYLSFWFARSFPNLEPVTASNPDKLKKLGHVRPGYSLAELRSKVMAAGLQVMSNEVALGL